MSTRIRKSTAWPAAAMAGIALAAPAHAALVVDWSGADQPGRPSGQSQIFNFSRIVETTGDYDGGGANDDARLSITFSEIDPLNPPHETDGYDTNLTNSVFYGGVRLTAYNPDPGDTELRARINAAGNNFDIRAVNRSADGIEMVAAIFWDKQDFLNGGDVDRVFLDAASSITLASAQSPHNMNSRILVRTADGQFYVSETSERRPLLTPEGAEGGNILDEMWAAYDPNSDLLFDTGTSFSTTTAELADITGFGFYFHRNSAGNFWIDNIEVNASIIPEPASVALVLGGVGLMLARRREQA